MVSFGIVTLWKKFAGFCTNPNGVPVFEAWDTAFSYRR